VCRLTLTTSREEGLINCRNLLEQKGYLEDSTKLSNDESCCVICPYYKSEYGGKISESQRVEEGGEFY